MMLAPGAAFMLTGVRIGPDTPGPSPTPRCTVPYATQLAACRRFYEVATHVCVSDYNAVAGPSRVQLPFTFGTSKRAAPSVITAVCTGGSYNVVSPPSAQHVSADGCVLTVDIVAGPAAFSTGLCVLTLDADVF